MLSKSWRDSQDRGFEFGCFFSILFSFFILAMVYPILLWQRLTLLIGVNFIIFVISRYLHRKNKNSIEKIFPVRQPQSIQIVENLLNAKQMPFTQQRQGKHAHFDLGEEEIEIIISPQSIRRRQLVNWPTSEMSLVRIRPRTAENEVFIQSLMQKLDDGFAPKGL